MNPDLLSAALAALLSLWGWLLGTSGALGYDL